MDVSMTSAACLCAPYSVSFSYVLQMSCSTGRIFSSIAHPLPPLPLNRDAKSKAQLFLVGLFRKAEKIPRLGGTGGFK